MSEAVLSAGLNCFILHGILLLVRFFSGLFYRGRLFQNNKDKRKVTIIIKMEERMAKKKQNDEGKQIKKTIKKRKVSIQKQSNLIIHSS